MGNATTKSVKASVVGVIIAATTSIATTACRRKLCIIAALITWIVALGFAVFAFFWFDRTFWSYLVAGCSFLLAYLVFSYLYTLLLKSDWISDAFYAVMKAGFKTLPSKVQAEDALGVLKTGFVKAIFLAVSYIVTTALLIVMTSRISTLSFKSASPSFLVPGIVYFL